MLERKVFPGVDVANIDVTLAECTAYSSSIYGDSRPPLGWQLVYSHVGSYGYVGACYAKNLLTTNVRAVFVHKGTAFSFTDVIRN